MSEIKIGDKVRIVELDYEVDGVSLRGYPNCTDGSLHIVIGISEENPGRMYHIVPYTAHWVGAFDVEIEKVE